jgi:hypothetical protein
MKAINQLEVQKQEVVAMGALIEDLLQALWQVTAGQKICNGISKNAAQIRQNRKRE